MTRTARSMNSAGVPSPSGHGARRVHPQERMLLVLELVRLYAHDARVQRDLERLGQAADLVDPKIWGSAPAVGPIPRVVTPAQVSQHLAHLDDASTEQAQEVAALALYVQRREAFLKRRLGTSVT